MADSSSEEKTEKPSAQKLRKAREEGQLPRSKDMGLAASLFAAFVVISSSLPWYADLYARVLSACISTRRRLITRR